MGPALIMAVAAALTSCGGGTSDEEVRASVEKGTAKGVLERTKLPSDTDCVVDAIMNGGLSENQLQVIATGGNPDPVEDEAWDKVKDEISNCD
jgi:hypothetical protein